MTHEVVFAFMAAGILYLLWIALAVKVGRNLFRSRTIFTFFLRCLLGVVFLLTGGIPLIGFMFGVFYGWGDLVDNKDEYYG